MLKIIVLNLPEVKATLAQPKKIVITTHLSPDADAIGSSVGLAEVLKSLNHQVSIVVPDIYPDFLAWMDEKKEIIAFDAHPQLSVNKLQQADIVFCLDYNKISRVGDGLADLINQSQALKFLIDHHRDPDSFPDFTLSDTEASSTAELIFTFLNDLNLQDKINLLAAESLYAGIITDTGNFRFNSTSVKTHLTVAKLMEIGVEVDKVYTRIYDQNSVNRLKLLGHVINNRMKVFEELNAVYFWITLNDKKEFNIKKGDTEGFVNYGLSVKGMNFSTFITEDDDKVKFSFRSKGKFNVHQFAQNYFNGGGHFNAAGGKTEQPLSQALKDFEDALFSESNQLLKPYEA